LNAAGGSLRTVVGASLEDHLSNITAPTLILVGGRDLTVSPAQGKLAALCIPNARLVEWPTAGHSMVDDRPDEFDQLLIDHLKQARSTSPFHQPFVSADHIRQVAHAPGTHQTFAS
jgi:pimeloyl-ACP methyl ester carboxylesterase